MYEKAYLQIREKVRDAKARGERADTAKKPSAGLGIAENFEAGKRRIAGAADRAASAIPASYTEEDNDPTQAYLNMMLQEFESEGIVSPEVASYNAPKSPVGSGTTEFVDGAELVAGLVKRGLPEHIAKGFVMNFQDESGLNPGINERAPIVKGSRGGYGLYQLTGPRRVAFERYADANGLPYDSADAQMDFLVYEELAGSEKAAWEKIQRTKTPGEAAAVIVKEFLRPLKEHQQSRTQKYLNRPYEFAQKPKEKPFMTRKGK